METRNSGVILSGWKLPSMIVVSLILSEIILRFSNTWGFVSYFVLVSGVLISLSKLEELDDFNKLSIVLMILPVLRILELFLNFGGFSKVVIESYLFLFLVVFYSFKFKIEVGYNKKGIGFLPLIVLLGIFFGILGNQLFNFDKNILILAILPVVVFSEEILFRGMIQNLFNKRQGLFFAILISSALYGVFSLSFGFSISVFFFFMSLISGLIYGFVRNIYLAFFFSFIVQLILFVF